MEEWHRSRHTRAIRRSCGLQNLATRAWFVTLPDGQETQIEPGRNVRLASGTKINFGVLKGEIEEP